MYQPSVSIAANVCAADTAIILHTVPSWLRVFGNQLSEILLIVDELSPVGRILAHHKQAYTNQDLYTAIKQVAALDSRVRYAALDYRTVRDTSLRWFGEPDVVRCQSGTPIFAFAYAIEKAESDIILRVDCDMLFFDRGWLGKGIQLLESETVDLVEPPKLGMNHHPYHNMISTRAFMLKPSAFIRKCTPLKAHRLDWGRRIHRYFTGRPTWLSLEEIFKKEKDRKRIKHELLDTDLGFSIHVYTREYAVRQHFKNVVTKIESGFVPSFQLNEGWNLVLDFWPELATL